MACNNQYHETKTASVEAEVLKGALSINVRKPEFRLAAVGARPPTVAPKGGRSRAHLQLHLKPW